MSISGHFWSLLTFAFLSHRKRSLARERRRKFFQGQWNLLQKSIILPVNRIWTFFVNLYSEMPSKQDRI